MPVNLIRDADIRAISIVDKGANRKRFFLTKADGDQAETLTTTRPLLKSEDWSVAYCVVAEPGWHEHPGIGAEEPDTFDRWADEDEIRKAAHRFMSNGGLVNKLHESLEPYGQLVGGAWPAATAASHCCAVLAPAPRTVPWSALNSEYFSVVPWAQARWT